MLDAQYTILIITIINQDDSHQQLMPVYLKSFSIYCSLKSEVISDRMSAFFYILIKKGKQNLSHFHMQVSIKCLSVFLCFSCIKEPAKGCEQSAFTQAHWHMGVSRTCIKFMVNYRHVFLGMFNRRLGTYYQRRNLTIPGIDFAWSYFAVYFHTLGWSVLVCFSLHITTIQD